MQPITSNSALRARRNRAAEAGIGEKSLNQLRARIRDAIEYAEAIPASELDGSDTREFVLAIGTDGRSMKFTGETFLKGFSLPNLFFHVTMTYAPLRHGGVELGKMDYLGAP